MSGSSARNTSMLAVAALVGGLLMACCQWLIYQYAPIEASMGLAQKIFYIHLPVAWWCFVGFFLACVASLLYLIKGNDKWDNLANAAVQAGLWSASLAIVTGMIWARTSWGVWWTWDPRLTTTFVLWLIYCAYLAIRQLDLPKTRKRRIAAVIAIIGFVDVPLVFLSARLMRSIHPAVFTRDSGGLTSEMAVAVIASVLIFGIIFACLLGLRFMQLKAGDLAEQITFDRIANEIEQERS